MLDDLNTLFGMFKLPMAAGLLIAAACSLLGVFVILKRVVFIGITLAEVAACGIAAAMALRLPPFAGAAVLTLAAVSLLALPYESRRVPRDAILGVVFVLAASLSVLIVSGSGFGLHEVKALLYGDLILTRAVDFAVILAVLTPVLAYLLLFMRPTLIVFIDRDAARVSGLRVTMWELLFFSALGLTVSASSRVAGSLLVFCYLVVSPAAALLLGRRLWTIMMLSAAISILATFAGLYLSVSLDWPTNQSISVAACMIFLAALVWKSIFITLPRRLRALVKR